MVGLDVGEVAGDLDQQADLLLAELGLDQADGVGHDPLDRAGGLFSLAAAGKERKSPPTIPAMRQPSLRMINASCSSSSRLSAARISWLELMMVLVGVLTSWAMPAASSPSMARWPVRRASASACSFSRWTTLIRSVRAMERRRTSKTLPIING